MSDQLNFWPPIAANDDPVMSHVAAAYVQRRGARGRQCQAILDRLRKGPATAQELAGLGTGILKYTSRISDLRANGIGVTCTIRNGISTYRLDEYE